MKTGLLSLTLLSALVLAGCDDEAKSIEWYQAHDKERNAKFETCKNDANPRGTEDCRNAIDATFRSGSYTKSPEKGW
ncbi:EexN family lipoprotein [Pantoea sp. Mb-10]|uniref:EexN family lipoprotein n=1 Tax=unclassified Pantoea TaxID=2630326 RepID=UPI001E4E482D|nr:MULTISPECIES: EexN family lipoprotein [unclassified Pantoea]MCE0491907.1 EexN family lipoprotein [Pantoea sp. Mb-10]MCE0503355.1 EexN family lipoprotein [Pantoea sp. Pb-8]